MFKLIELDGIEIRGKESQGWYCTHWLFVDKRSVLIVDKLPSTTDFASSGSCEASTPSLPVCDTIRHVHLHNTITTLHSTHSGCHGDLLTNCHNR